MNTQHERDIDRLIDGELTEAQRRELLLRLNTEPDGWRRCALAFLEAQSWREALTEKAPNEGPARVDSWPRRRRWMRPAQWTALAASLALAFLLGHGWRDANTYKPDVPPLDATVAPVLVEHNRPATPKTTPVAYVDPVVERLEQQGFAAETQNRLLPCKLSDGRAAAIPVQVVRFQYVGGHVY